jgi:hypothetical protein
VEVERDGVTQRLLQVHWLVADVECQQGMATWCQHPAELGERVRQPLIGDVDGRIPGQGERFSG